MNSEQGRRRAAVLVILAAVLWLHEWFPALFVVAFVVWILLHKRFEGDLGKDLLRLGQRVWPPASLVLVPAMVAGTVAYWASDQPITTRVLPISLNLLALSMVVCGGWWRVFVYSERFSPIEQEPSNKRSTSPL